MKKVLFTALALLFVSSQAFGYHFFDNSIQLFDGNNNWAPISYPSGIGHYPSPGPNQSWEGGEKFDLEGLNVREDADNIYIGITNSFGWQAHSTAWNSNYHIGDLFIGVDGGNPYEFAIDINATGAGSLWQVRSWNYIDNRAGTYYNVPSIRNQVGAYEVASGTELGDVEGYLTDLGGIEENPMWSYETQTYLYEFCFDKSLLGGFNTLDFHATLACGNDVLVGSYSAIPEPTTMVLFGLGLLGTGLLRRRSK